MGLNDTVPVQLFPALSETGVVGDGFSLGICGLEGESNREYALQGLEHYHREQLAKIGPRSLRLAQQIHGNGVATIDAGSAAKTKEVDGLITADPKIVLGICVADCCAIFLVDPIRRVIGLVHSGKKGTEQNIIGLAVRKLRTDFQSEPKDLIAVLSPCIRPPSSEVAFAQWIKAQFWAETVNEINDTEEHTGADLTRFYS